MSTLTEIEDAIDKLPDQDVRSLLRHLQQRDALAWDQQFAEDAENGKLDAVYAQLTQSSPISSKLPLHEILDDPKFS